MARLDHHALLWRLLAGCMQDDPGMLADILGDDAEPDELRNNILEAAFDVLPVRPENLLWRLARLHFAAEFDDVLGFVKPPLGLRPPPPPPRARLREVEDKLAAETDLDTRRELKDRRDDLRARCEEWDIYRALADTYERLPAVRAHHAAVHADLCLLETRGFLTWDRSSNRYDLHPLVRAHALERLEGHDESNAASEAIRDHFIRSPREHSRDVHCIADLRRSLDLFHAYLDLGDRDRASAFYEEHLQHELNEHLSAYPVTVELLTPLFPDGLLEPPWVYSHLAESRRISDLSYALAQVGRENDAAAMREVAVRLNLARRRPYSLVISLWDRARSLATANRTHAAMRTHALAHRLTVALGREHTGLRHDRAVLATDLGRWDEAEADMTALGEKHDTIDLDLCRAAIAFGRGEDPAPFLKEASVYLTLGWHAYVAARWNLLSGRIKAAGGAFATALPHLSAAVQLTRRMGADGARAHAWRAVCLANLDRHAEARRALADARVAATHHDNRRVAGILAAAHLALGERDLAGPLALAGYREAWADGPRFSWFDDLRVCTGVLAELGLSPPDLPTFDPASSPQPPFEAKIEAFIAELAAQRTGGGSRLVQLDPTLCEPPAKPGQGPPPPPGPPAFAVNGRVKIVTDAPWQADFNGQEGVVFWRDPMQDHTAVAETQRWNYIVYVPAKHRYRTLIERHLAALEGSVEPSYFFGERAEISYDIVVTDDSRIVEGCVRLRGETWRTLFAKKVDDLPEARLRAFDWDNGIRGLALEMPGNAPMNKAAIQQALASLLGVEQIVEAPGPDSMMMRP
jgi:tetratricopeptide (TPR) repeat protein